MANQKKDEKKDEAKNAPAAPAATTPAATKSDAGEVVLADATDDIDFYPFEAGSPQQLAQDLASLIRVGRNLERWEARLFTGKDKLVQLGDIDQRLRNPDMSFDNIGSRRRMRDLLECIEAGVTAANTLLTDLVTPEAGEQEEVAPDTEA